MELNGDSERLWNLERSPTYVQVGSEMTRGSLSSMESQDSSQSGLSLCHVSLATPGRQQY